MGDQNVKHLMVAADMLAIGSVETECFNFLKTNLTVSNCIRRFAIADAKPSWHKLARHVQRFIQLRFDQLMKQTQVSEDEIDSRNYYFAKLVELSWDWEPGMEKKMALSSSCLYQTHVSIQEKDA